MAWVECYSSKRSDNLCSTRSDTPRPMMAITFGEVDKNHDPFTTNRGRTEFYPNWYSTSRLGRLRERVTVKVPFTYSAYRFATSVISDKGYESY